CVSSMSSRTIYFECSVALSVLLSFPTRRSSDLGLRDDEGGRVAGQRFPAELLTSRGFRGPDEPSDQLTRHVLEARLGPAGPVEGLAGPVGGGLQTAQRLVHLRVRDLRQVPLPGDVEQFGLAVLTGEVGEVEVACDD